MTYTVMIELAGESVKVGQISEAGFAYDPIYLSQNNVKPISVSLPLQEEPFSTQRTKNFFDGLLSYSHSGLLFQQ